MRRQVTLCIFASLALESTLALACPIGRPLHGHHIILPKGEVSRGAHILVENYPYDRYELWDEDGNPVEFTTVMTRPIGPQYEARLRLVPETELEPGTYTVAVVKDYNPDIDDHLVRLEETTTFTITDAPLPPPPTPPSNMEWRTLRHSSDAEEPESCHSSYYHHTHSHNIKVTKDPSVMSYVSVVALEGHRIDGMMNNDDSESLTFEFTEDTPTPACISATVTDIYGRTSEPTTICVPTHCEYREEYDVYASSVDHLTVGCDEWAPENVERPSGSPGDDFPGYPERNAFGCACAQSPAAPTPAPWLAALALLGLLRVRASRSRSC